jgi:hypothetical protein
MASVGRWPKRAALWASFFLYARIVDSNRPALVPIENQQQRRSEEDQSESQ